jgi:hypothetical protein
MDEYAGRASSSPAVLQLKLTRNPDRLQETDKSPPDRHYTHGEVYTAFVESLTI